MKLRKFTDSINHAVDGIIYAFKTERNLKIHFAITLCVLAACLVLDLDRLEVVMVFFAIALVIVAEMINTAIEAFVNLLTLSHHPLARISKDVAAGGVLIAAVNALAVSYLIIFSSMKKPLLDMVVTKARGSMAHITLIILFIIIIIVVIGKTLGKRGTFTQGGLVSGHAAVAFGVSTAILLATRNIFATSLAFFLAVLVAQSRMEAKFHKWFEVVLGAIIGIGTSLLIYYVFYLVK
ncbi:MAG: diacylglycerol kinase [Firmicutes bacterium]|nr:diacylglycerol kinase [Bacillota bacterium]